MLPLLLVLVLLGNGLRSVISSTIFVSEGTFASFLKISVTKTSVIIELLLGAVLLSLLVSPKLIDRYTERALATTMCVIAGAASLGLAAMFWANPPVATREALVIVLFPLIGFSLASLAPLAQLMTDWGGGRHTKLLTGTWAVAMPAAFLVTPQLVRVVAPRYGLDVYFAGFALMPLFLVPAIWFVGVPKVPKSSKMASSPGKSVLPAILCLLAFELMTLLVTLSGVTSPLTQGAAVLFVGSLAFLLRHRSTHQSTVGQKRNMYTLRVFAFLFVVNIATTGFYDTSYLVLHMCSNTLVADRATLGALAQVIAAVGATAMLARYAVQSALMVIGGVITAIGVGSYLLYFGSPFYEVFVGSKAITGFGMGLLTTAAIFAVKSTETSGTALSLFIAFVIIIGTEVGLEAFEIFVQLAELAAVPEETRYQFIFVAQAVLVLSAIPLVLLKKTDT
jgi:MFS family permease